MLPAIYDMALEFNLQARGEIMNRRIETPFNSIENAQHYIKLLGETVTESKADINHEIELATAQKPQRHVEALRLVEFNLQKLEGYLSAVGRTLNDLRSLRRLLLEEKPVPSEAEHERKSTISPPPPAAVTLPDSIPLRFGKWGRLQSANKIPSVRIRELNG